MAAMGFLAPISVSRPALPLPAIREEETMLEFDSGNAISFADGTHNTLIVGSTGSGKTSSAVLPACDALIRAGYGGLIVDIKGTMGPQVRALARACGREADIVEYGTTATSQPVNLLHGMSLPEIREFFKRLIDITGMRHQSGYWGNAGVEMAVDAIDMMYCMGQKVAYPTFASITEMLTRPTVAKWMWRLFSNQFFDSKKKRHARLKERVESDTFHFLEGKEDDEHYNSQVTWRLHSVKVALGMLVEDENLKKNFSNSTGISVDVDKIFTRKKIILLSFPGAGSAVAGTVSRFIVESYYRKVLLGRTGPEDYTFIVADEYQELQDLSQKPLSDNTFTAKAREFRSIQILSTQSLSSLLGRGADAGAVEELVNNCNQRIMYYCDDTYTQQTASKYSDDIVLSRIGKTKCFVVGYDSNERNHYYRVDTLQREHDRVALVIADNRGEAPALKYKYKDVDLDAVKNELEEIIKAKNQKEKPEKKLEEKPEKKPEERQEERTDEDRWREKKMMARTAERQRVEALERQLFASLSPEMQQVINEYRDFFVLENGVKEMFDLPPGWVAVLEKGLKVVKKMNGAVAIGGFRIEKCYPVVVGRSDVSPWRQVLNNYLTVCAATCPVCGKNKTNTPDMYQPPMFPCSDCFHGAGLQGPTEEICKDLPQDFWFGNEIKTKTGFAFDPF